uniref:Uncharacterized protein n=1 Tax=Oryza punctata TaxID=4537 RepID=A0A0E0JY38_ORYPU
MVAGNSSGFYGRKTPISFLGGVPVEAQFLSIAADDKSVLHGGQLRNYSSTSMSNESLNSATNRFPSIKKVQYCCVRCAQEGAKACMNKKHARQHCCSSLSRLAHSGQKNRGEGRGMV